jgi:hypothetical protein
MLTATAGSHKGEFDDLIEGIVDAVREKLLSSRHQLDKPLKRSDSGQIDESDNSDESRRERRRRVLMDGKITGGRRHASIDCSIRNLSTKGACVRIDGIQHLPENFQLYIQREGLVRDANIVWRKNFTAGVVFSGWEQQIDDTDFTDRNSVLEFVKSMGIAKN